MTNDKRLNGSILIQKAEKDKGMLGTWNWELVAGYLLNGQYICYATTVFPDMSF